MAGATTTACLLLILASCAVADRKLLSAFTVEWPEEVGNGPRGPNPWDPPEGGSKQKVQGTTVSTVLTPNPTVCKNYCASVSGAKYYNYCNDPGACGGVVIGGCSCKTFEGAPQFVADTAFISGPVASGSSSAGAPTNLFPAYFYDSYKNLQGTLISTSNVGEGNQDACKAKCAATPECSGYNFCTQSGGCGGFPAGTCDLKRWEGKPAYYDDQTQSAGDGWSGSIRERTDSLNGVEP